MKRTLSISLCALLLSAPLAVAQVRVAQDRVAQGQNVQGGTAGRIDEPVATDVFVQRASASSRFEIRSSELARQKAGSDVLKGFAQEMIRDHTTMGQRLQAALGSAARPQTPEAELQEPMFRKVLEQLEQASGAQFDQLYTEAQMNAHEDAVTLFRTYASSGEDERLRAFAKESLPTLERHRVRIREIAEKRG